MEAAAKGKSKNQKRREKEKEKKRNVARSKKQDDSEDEHEEELPSACADCVVKVYASITPPNFESPWAMQPSMDVSGSGFVVAGRRILTNAHCVGAATFVAVRRSGEAKRYVARVAAIAHDVDLAVLTVADGAFFTGLSSALSLSKEVPRIMDEVLVAGFPEGGDTLSLTRGIVSRVEFGPFTESLDALTIQIDAAINHGNSGGPVFMGREVVGVAFSGLDNADGIGYLIPSRLVTHFLEDLKRNNGAFRGLCSLGIEIQGTRVAAGCPRVIAHRHPSDGK